MHQNTFPECSIQTRLVREEPPRFIRKSCEGKTIFTLNLTGSRESINAETINLREGSWQQEMNRLTLERRKNADPHKLQSLFNASDLLLSSLILITKGLHHTTFAVDPNYTLDELTTAAKEWLTHRCVPGENVTFEILEGYYTEEYTISKKVTDTPA